MSEGAFQVPSDSYFHAGQLLDQLSPGGSKSCQSVSRIIEGFFDGFSLGDELWIKGRRHNVPTLFGFLKSKNDSPIAPLKLHGVSCASLPCDCESYEGEIADGRF